MTDPNYKLDVAMKAAQWERAKGELRALAVLQGSYQSGTGNGDRWMKLHQKVESFIRDIEEDALQE